MAMTIKTEGIEKLERMLGQLGDKAQDVASVALYKGAGIVADAFKAAVNSIHAEPQHKKNRPPEKTPARWPTPEEKAALAGKTGIAKFKNDGSEINTIVGVTRSAGYVQIGSRKKPVIEIARAINSGTSFMHKQPVFRKAKTKCRKTAQDTIASTAEEMFNKIINGK